MAKPKPKPRSLQDRVGELEDELKQRERRINELKTELTKAEALVTEMRQQIEDANGAKGKAAIVQLERLRALRLAGGKRATDIAEPYLFPAYTLPLETHR